MLDEIDAILKAKTKTSLQMKKLKAQAQQNQVKRSSQFNFKEVDRQNLLDTDWALQDMEIDHFGNNEKIDDFIRRRELTKYVDAAGIVEPYDSMHTIDSMYEESMAKTKSVREDPEIRQKMKKFASDGAKPKDFSSLNADQKVIAKRMKARYELLNSGTPEASSRN